MIVSKCWSTAISVSCIKPNCEVSVCVYSTVISAENTFTRQTKVVGSKEICILALWLLPCQLVADTSPLPSPALFLSLALCLSPSLSQGHHLTEGLTWPDVPSWQGCYSLNTAAVVGTGTVAVDEFEGPSPLGFLVSDPGSSSGVWRIWSQCLVGWCIWRWGVVAVQVGWQ